MEMLFLDLFLLNFHWIEYQIDGYLVFVHIQSNLKKDL